MSSKKAIDPSKPEAQTPSNEKASDSSSIGSFFTSLVSPLTSSSQPVDQQPKTPSSTNRFNVPAKFMNAFNPKPQQPPNTATDAPRSQGTTPRATPQQNASTQQNQSAPTTPVISLNSVPTTTTGTTTQEQTPQAPQTNDNRQQSTTLDNTIVFNDDFFATNKTTTVSSSPDVNNTNTSDVNNTNTSSSSSSSRPLTPSQSGSATPRDSNVSSTSDIIEQFAQNKEARTRQQSISNTNAVNAFAQSREQKQNNHDASPPQQQNKQQPQIQQQQPQQSNKPQNQMMKKTDLLLQEHKMALSGQDYDTTLAPTPRLDGQPAPTDEYGQKKSVMSAVADLHAQHTGGKTSTSIHDEKDNIPSMYTSGYQRRHDTKFSHTSYLPPYPIHMNVLQQPLGQHLMIITQNNDAFVRYVNTECNKKHVTEQINHFDGGSYGVLLGTMPIPSSTTSNTNTTSLLQQNNDNTSNNVLQNMTFSTLFYQHRTAKDIISTLNTMHKYIFDEKLLTSAKNREIYSSLVKKIDTKLQHLNTELLQAKQHIDARLSKLNNKNNPSGGGGSNSSMSAIEQRQNDTYLRYLISTTQRLIKKRDIFYSLKYSPEYNHSMYTTLRLLTGNDPEQVITAHSSPLLDSSLNIELALNSIKDIKTTMVSANDVIVESLKGELSYYLGSCHNIHHYCPHIQQNKNKLTTQTGHGMNNKIPILCVSITNASVIASLLGVTTSGSFLASMVTAKRLIISPSLSCLHIHILFNPTNKEWYIDQDSFVCDISLTRGANSGYLPSSLISMILQRTLPQQIKESFITLLHPLIGQYIYNYTGNVIASQGKMYGSSLLPQRIYSQALDVVPKQTTRQAWEKLFPTSAATVMSINHANQVIAAEAMGLPPPPPPILTPPTAGGKSHSLSLFNLEQWDNMPSDVVSMQARAYINERIITLWNVHRTDLVKHTVTRINLLLQISNELNTNIPIYDQLTQKYIYPNNTAGNSLQKQSATEKLSRLLQLSPIDFTPAQIAIPYYRVLHCVLQMCCPGYDKYVLLENGSEGTSIETIRRYLLIVIPQYQLIGHLLPGQSSKNTSSSQQPSSSSTSSQSSSSTDPSRKGKHTRHGSISSSAASEYYKYKPLAISDVKTDAQQQQQRNNDSTSNISLDINQLTSSTLQSSQYGDRDTPRHKAQVIAEALEHHEIGILQILFGVPISIHFVRLLTYLCNIMDIISIASPQNVYDQIREKNTSPIIPYVPIYQHWLTWLFIACLRSQHQSTSMKIESHKFQARFGLQSSLEYAISLVDIIAYNKNILLLQQQSSLYIQVTNVLKSWITQVYKNEYIAKLNNTGNNANNNPNTLTVNGHNVQKYFNHILTNKLDEVKKIYEGNIENLLLLSIQNSSKIQVFLMDVLKALNYFISQQNIITSNCSFTLGNTLYNLISTASNGSSSNTSINNTNTGTNTLQSNKVIDFIRVLQAQERTIARSGLWGQLSRYLQDDKDYIKQQYDKHNKENDQCLQGDNSSSGTTSMPDANTLASPPTLNTSLSDFFDDDGSSNNTNPKSNGDSKTSKVTPYPVPLTLAPDRIFYTKILDRKPTPEEEKQTLEQQQQQQQMKGKNTSDYTNHNPGSTTKVYSTSTSPVSASYGMGSGGRDLVSIASDNAQLGHGGSTNNNNNTSNTPTPVAVEETLIPLYMAPSSFVSVTTTEKYDFLLSVRNTQSIILSSYPEYMISPKPSSSRNRIGNIHADDYLIANHIPRQNTQNGNILLDNNGVVLPISSWYQQYSDIDQNIQYKSTLVIPIYTLLSYYRASNILDEGQYTYLSYLYHADELKELHHKLSCDAAKHDNELYLHDVQIEKDEYNQKLQQKGQDDDNNTNATTPPSSPTPVAAFKSKINKRNYNTSDIYTIISSLPSCCCQQCDPYFLHFYTMYTDQYLYDLVKRYNKQQSTLDDLHNLVNDLCHIHCSGLKSSQEPLNDYSKYILLGLSAGTNALEYLPSIPTSSSSDPPSSTTHPCPVCIRRQYCVYDVLPQTPLYKQLKSIQRTQNIHDIDQTNIIEHIITQNNNNNNNKTNDNMSSISTIDDNNAIIKHNKRQTRGKYTLTSLQSPTSASLSAATQQQQSSNNNSSHTITTGYTLQNIGMQESILGKSVKIITNYTSGSIYQHNDQVIVQSYLSTPLLSKLLQFNIQQEMPSLTAAQKYTYNKQLLYALGYTDNDIYTYSNTLSNIDNNNNNKSINNDHNSTSMFNFNMIDSSSHIINELSSPASSSSQRNKSILQLPPSCLYGIPELVNRSNFLSLTDESPYLCQHYLSTPYTSIHTPYYTDYHDYFYTTRLLHQYHEQHNCNQYHTTDNMLIGAHSCNLYGNNIIYIPTEYNIQQYDKSIDVYQQQQSSAHSHLQHQVQHGQYTLPQTSSSSQNDNANQQHRQQQQQQQQPIYSSNANPLLVPPPQLHPSTFKHYHYHDINQHFSQLFDPNYVNNTGDNSIVGGTSTSMVSSSSRVPPSESTEPQQQQQLVSTTPSPSSSSSLMSHYQSIPDIVDGRTYSQHIHNITSLCSCQIPHYDSNFSLSFNNVLISNDITFSTYTSLINKYICDVTNFLSPQSMFTIDTNNKQLNISYSFLDPLYKHLLYCYNMICYGIHVDLFPQENKRQWGRYKTLHHGFADTIPSGTLSSSSSQSSNQTVRISEGSWIHPILAQLNNLSSNELEESNKQQQQQRLSDNTISSTPGITSALLSTMSNSSSSLSSSSSSSSLHGGQSQLSTSTSPYDLTLEVDTFSIGGSLVPLLQLDRYLNTYEVYFPGSTMPPIVQALYDIKKAKEQVVYSHSDLSLRNNDHNNQYMLPSSPRSSTAPGSSTTAAASLDPFGMTSFTDQLSFIGPDGQTFIHSTLRNEMRSRKPNKQQQQHPQQPKQQQSSSSTVTPTHSMVNTSSTTLSPHVATSSSSLAQSSASSSSLTGSSTSTSSPALSDTPIIHIHHKNKILTPSEKALHDKLSIDLLSAATSTVANSNTTSSNASAATTDDTQQPLRESDIMQQRTIKRLIYNVLLGISHQFSPYTGTIVQYNQFSIDLHVTCSIFKNRNNINGYGYQYPSVTQYLSSLSTNNFTIEKYLSLLNINKNILPCNIINDIYKQFNTSSFIQLPSMPEQLAFFPDASILGQNIETLTFEQKPLVLSQRFPWLAYMRSKESRHHSNQNTTNDDWQHTFDLKQDQLSILQDNNDNKNKSKPPTNNNSSVTVSLYDYNEIELSCSHIDSTLIDNEIYELKNEYINKALQKDIRIQQQRLQKQQQQQEVDNPDTSSTQQQQLPSLSSNINTPNSNNIDPLTLLDDHDRDMYVKRLDEINKRRIVITLSLTLDFDKILHLDFNYDYICQLLTEEL